MTTVGNKTTAARWVTIEGVRKRVHQWCRDLGLHYPTIRSRITKYGYSPRDAILDPIHDSRPDAHDGADPHDLRVIAAASGMPILVRRPGGRTPKRVMGWRRACIHAAYHLGHHTLVNIGKFFGGKNHVTVLWHTKRFDELLEAGDSSAIKMRDKITKWLDFCDADPAIELLGPDHETESADTTSDVGA